MRHLKYCIALAVILCAASSLRADAVPANGDFGDGLNNWNAGGDVSAAGGLALFKDALPATGGSLLWQAVALGPGAYTFEFDVRSGLAFNPTADDGGFVFPDAFFAALYFIDDIASFDLDSLAFDAALMALGLDHAGVQQISGSLNSSVLGQEWLHFTMSFTNSYQYVIPLFQLIDLDTDIPNSWVELDNVAIAPIPEPATWLLVGGGLAGWFGGARARRRRV